MPHHALVTVFGPDRPGLIAEIAGRLFDLGINLGDLSFAVLGEAADFSVICEVPDGIDLAALKAEVAAIDLPPATVVEVVRFPLAPLQPPSGRTTHRIEFDGLDQPGLIARLSEILLEYGANIVRLEAEKVVRADGDSYAIRIAARIPPDAAEACLATLANTAGELRMACRWAAV